MHDGRQARLGGQLHVVRKREKAVRGQHRSPGLVSGILDRQPDRAHAAGLALPDPHGHVLPDQDDGIGCDVFRGDPCEGHVPQFLLARAPPAHHAKRRLPLGELIRLLDEPSAQHAAPFRFRRRREPLQRDQAEMRLLGEATLRRGIDHRRDNHLQEHRRHLGGGGRIQRPIDRHDAPKGRFGVSRMRPLVGVGDRLGAGDGARRGMLDDHAGRPLELHQTAQRGIEIQEIVIGERLAL